MDVRAEYIGTQESGNDFKFRLYNVVGEHRLNGSTVDVATLVAEGIEIPDLTKEEIEAERKAIKAFLEAPL